MSSDNTSTYIFTHTNKDSVTKLQKMQFPLKIKLIISFQIMLSHLQKRTQAQVYQILILNELTLF